MKKSLFSETMRAIQAEATTEAEKRREARRRIRLEVMGIALLLVAIVS